MRAYLLMVLFAIAPHVAAEEDREEAYDSYRANTYEIQEAYLQHVTDHQIRIMDDLERKLDQQRWQTNAIAVMVFIMVGVGLYLSYLQFKRDSETGDRPSFSLKIGSGSFELSSSVIGLVLIVLSFWFFQTYISRVYEVHIFQVPPIDATTFGVNR